MQCYACGHQNRAGARFCTRCRSSLETQTCASCHSENRREAKRCKQCGVALSQSCHRCGHTNRLRAQHCSHCGNSLVLICRHCQTPNRSGAKYCRKCAANLVLPGMPQHVGNTGRHQGGRLIHQRYQVISKIAQGGMGAVYKVRDTQHPQHHGGIWALKEMSLEAMRPDELEDAVTIFHQEADLLRQLTHPNLIRVLERFSEFQKEYLVMEHVDGVTLMEQLNQQRFSESDVLRIALQLCDVLSYLHNQHPAIIYRDLKPDNIMLETQSGRVKLIDFGIVRFHKPGKTKDTESLGTPGFAPPEQYGKGQTDARSDVFALGVTLLVLLTAYDVSQNPWKYPPVRSLNPTISQQMEAAIIGATQLKQDERYKTMDEMRQALLRCPGATQIAQNLPTKQGQVSLASHSLAQAQGSPNLPSGRGTPVLAQSQPAHQPPNSTSHGNGTSTRVSPATVVAQSPPIQNIPVQNTVSPVLSQTIQIAPSSLSVKTTPNQHPERELQIHRPSGLGIQGQAYTTASWIRVEPTLLDEEDRLLVQIEPSQVHLPKGQFKAPNLFLWAWRWAVNQGASVKPWREVKKIGVTLLTGIPVVLLGGPAYILLWLIYWHASQWVRVSVNQTEQIEIRTQQDIVTIPIEVEINPMRWWSWSGWLMAGIVVIGEVGLVIWLFILWFTRT